MKIIKVHINDILVCEKVDKNSGVGITSYLNSSREVKHTYYKLVEDNYELYMYDHKGEDYGY
jgi:hypothetical protein